MVRVKTTIDVKGVKPRINQMVKRGQYALVNQVYADMNPYVPAKDYDLRNQSNANPTTGEIIYSVPYARPLFYNLYHNYTTPGTGPRWDQKALSIHGKSWERVTERAMK